MRSVCVCVCVCVCVQALSECAHIVHTSTYVAKYSMHVCMYYSVIGVFPDPVELWLALIFTAEVHYHCLL